MARIWIGLAAALGLAVTTVFAGESGKTEVPRAAARVLPAEEQEPAGAAIGAPAAATTPSAPSRAGGRGGFAGGRGGMPSRGLPATGATAASEPAAEAAWSAEPLTVLKSGTPEHTRLVYHLKVSPANTISNTIKQLFRVEAELGRSEGATAKGTSARNVAIVPSIVDNSLVISGPPDAVEEVRKLVDELDQFRGIILLDMEMGEAPAGEAKAAAATPMPEGKSAAVAAGQFRLVEKPPQMETIGHIRLTTLDNQPAYVQIGARIPRVTGTSLTTKGTINTTTLENVGTIFAVTPRISADGSIVMNIEVSSSRLGPESEGAPISITGDQVIRSPRIDTTTIQTTIRIPDGQTAVLGSSARESKSGKEMLIVVTPHIIGLGEAKKAP